MSANMQIAATPLVVMGKTKSRLKKAYELYVSDRSRYETEFYTSIIKYAEKRFYHLEKKFADTSTAKTMDDYVQEAVIAVWNQLATCSFQGTPLSFPAFVEEICDYKEADFAKYLKKESHTYSSLTVEKKEGSDDSDEETYEEDNPEIYKQGAEIDLSGMPAKSQAILDFLEACGQPFCNGTWQHVQRAFTAAYGMSFQESEQFPSAFSRIRDRLEMDDADIEISFLSTRARNEWREARMEADEANDDLKHAMEKAQREGVNFAPDDALLESLRSRSTVLTERASALFDARTHAAIGASLSNPLSARGVQLRVTAMKNLFLAAGFKAKRMEPSSQTSVHRNQRSITELVAELDSRQFVLLMKSLKKTQRKVVKAAQENPTLSNRAVWEAAKVSLATEYRLTASIVSALQEAQTL